ncbi:hypothetical protein IFM89_036245 [Coptis chinensis]|uniref:UspA domain-containing protein n=1 Tax=Coptis chinensis TaxID=261450 RepID=A0A835HS55_9MAGN|nr:hypothetical protein IFM89_036245 [Coptis chinensis]
MTEKLKCVVVAVNSSEESMNALNWALHNLKLHSSDSDEGESSALVILHVQPSPSIFAGVSPAPIPFIGPSDPEVPAFAAAIEAHQKRISEAIIAHALEICSEEKPQMNVKTQVVVGDPKEVICEVVYKLNADLLVMGSHSYGPILRMFLGSVSNYCTNQAHCPVVVVKDSS